MLRTLGYKVSERNIELVFEEYEENEQLTPIGLLLGGRWLTDKLEKEKI